VLFIASLSPYAASSVEVARIAAAKGVRTIAVSDSSLSPVATSADVTILVSARSPSFFDTISPALAASEMLVALVASRRGADVPGTVRGREERLQEAGVFWRERPQKARP
jgi:DNA-binding MurR/RpiR family transcriptional regulator